jgi:hypothetical protein
MASKITPEVEFCLQPRRLRFLKSPALEDFRAKSARFTRTFKAVSRLLCLTSTHPEAEDE